MAWRGEPDSSVLGSRAALAEVRSRTQPGSPGDGAQPSGTPHGNRSPSSWPASRTSSTRSQRSPAVHKDQQTEWRERRAQAADWAQSLPHGLAEDEVQRRAVDTWGDHHRRQRSHRQWLADAHEALDVAVAAAYGWSADISDDDVLRRVAGAQRRLATSLWSTWLRSVSSPVDTHADYEPTGPSNAGEPTTMGG